MNTLPLRVSLLAVAETTGSSLYGLYDVLSSVGRAWAVATGNDSAASPVEVRIVAATEGVSDCARGVPVRADALPAHAGDIVCVPSLALATTVSFAGRYPRETAWLRAAHRHGAFICSACSGALLLAEAGLLDGLEATTHWAFSATLRRQYPRVRLREARILVSAGEGERIVTAGGAASWNDLALYLIGRFCGGEHAVQTAKMYLLEGHATPQLAYAAMNSSVQHGDPKIRDCQCWIASHYALPDPVAGMFAQSSLPARSFLRRFKAATGLSPLAYVQTLRIEEAKQLLEATDQAIDDVAAAVGYDDAAFFRRLFKRKTCLTPAQYRRRYRPLRRGDIG